MSEHFEESKHLPWSGDLDVAFRAAEAAAKIGPLTEDINVQLVWDGSTGYYEDFDEPRERAKHDPPNRTWLHLREGGNRLTVSAEGESVAVMGQGDDWPRIRRAYRAACKVLDDAAPAPNPVPQASSTDSIALPSATVPVAAPTRSAHVERSHTHWKGSLETLIQATELALRELARPDYSPTANVTIDYGEEDESFKSLAGLRAGLGTINVSEIEVVRIAFGGSWLQSDEVRGTIRASKFSGVTITVDGPTRSLVRGIADTLYEELSVGAQSAREWTSLAPRGRLAYALTSLYLLLAFAVPFVSDLDWWIRASESLAFLALGYVFLPGARVARIRSDKHLLLVSDTAKDAPLPSPHGPVARAQDWVQRHLLISMALSLVVATATNVAANVISSHL